MGASEVGFSSPQTIIWWFPKIMGTFLVGFRVQGSGVPIIRIIVYWGPPILGNYQKASIKGNATRITKSEGFQGSTQLGA